MKYIDMHCDTLMPFADGVPYNIHRNNMMVDFEKLKAGDCSAQFFAMFLPAPRHWEREGKTPIPDWEYLKMLSAGFYANINANSDMIAFAGNADDWHENEKAGKMSAFLTIEDGRAVGGDMTNLTTFYDMGVRLISLTWNFENCFGYPNSKDPDIMSRGLKPFGIEAMPVMNDFGIIIDVSHLSDGGFYDVAKYSKKPFVASHSNCRAITGHTRNLTDDMIKVLADTGSVSGINFGPDFITPDGEKLICSVENIITHIRHFVDVGGIDCVGIGTDFDGVRGEMEIDNASKMDLLFTGLEKAGFTDDQIEKIAFKNVARVIEESMK